MNEEIDILLARYFSGEANADELRQLDAWLSESEEHEAYFDQMTSLYRKTGGVPPMPEPDTQKALSQFKEYINKPSEIAVKKSIWKRPFTYGLAAASIALLVGVFVFVEFYLPETIYLEAEAKDTRYMLSENKEIILFEGSQIYYKGKNKNEITLTGKAHFSVNSEKGESILIKAGETYIKDIGTQFTVTAYKPGEGITVEVQQGEVRFYTPNDSGINLKENEKGYYDTKTKQFSYVSKQVIAPGSQVENTDSPVLPEENQKQEQTQRQEQSGKPNTEIPKQGMKNEKPVTVDENLEFNSAYLYEVIDILKNRYRVNILFEDNSMRTMRISVSFSSNESIDNILNIIAETLSIQISKHGANYTISKK